MKICLLTLSEKFGNKCVVGYDYINDRVIRLVSSLSADGIEKYILKDFKLLDIVDVNIGESAPLECQKENILLATNDIKKVGCENIDFIDKLSRKSSPNNYIFGNNSHKLETNNNINHSIEIIKFRNMTIKDNGYGKNKAYFEYNNSIYSNFSITDNNYYNRENYHIKNGYAIITIPVSDDFTIRGGGYFKYIAAIYEIKNLI